MIKASPAFTALIALQCSVGLIHFAGLSLFGCGAALGGQYICVCILSSPNTETISPRGHDDTLYMEPNGGPQKRDAVCTTATLSHANVHVSTTQAQIGEQTQKGPHTFFTPARSDMLARSTYLAWVLLAY